jgi:hypothetical protein
MITPGGQGAGPLDTKPQQDLNTPQHNCDGHHDGKFIHFKNIRYQPFRETVLASR